MQEGLPPGLARELRDELRKETCPQRVIDDARRKIAAETGGASVPASRRLRYVIPAAFAGMVLLCGLLLARWRPAGGNATQQPELAEQQTHGHSPTQVARETKTALALIGTALLDAGARSETAVSDRAIPPLQHGFDTAKDKIIRHAQL
jgi:hypothetical protein